MKVDPILYNLLKELRAGRFRPRAIRRFVTEGIGHAIDLAWSLDDLRHSFYLASAVMFVVLAAIGSLLAMVLPGGVGIGTWVAEGALFVLVFGLTLLQLGLVRAETSFVAYDRFALPNVLTLLRLLVIPYLARCIAVAVETAGVEGEPTLSAYTALGLVLFAVISDVLDGTLSRRLGLTSDFGRIYDPIVDAAFHSAMAIALFTNGLAGEVYVMVVLVRYMLPPVAGSFLYLFREQFQVKSTVMGKLSSLILSVYLSFMMMIFAFASTDCRCYELLRDYGEPACVLICVATIAFFLGRGIKILKRTKKR